MSSKDLIEVPVTEHLSLNQTNSFPPSSRCSSTFPPPSYFATKVPKGLNQSFGVAEAEDDNRKGGLGDEDGEDDEITEIDDIVEDEDAGD